MVTVRYQTISHCQQINEISAYKPSLSRLEQMQRYMCGFRSQSIQLWQTRFPCGYSDSFWHSALLFNYIWQSTINFEFTLSVSLYSIIANHHKWIFTFVLHVMRLETLNSIICTINKKYGVKHFSYHCREPLATWNKKK